MPVGRFRDDPRALDERAREVYARQYPEGVHAVGSFLGLVGPVALDVVAPSAPPALTSPLTAIFGLVLGGVGGYLLGYWYRERKLRAVSARPDAADSPSATAASDGPPAGRDSHTPPDSDCEGGGPSERR